MKTRTILGLLMIGALLTAGGSSALAQPAAPTLKIVPGGWCNPTTTPAGGILFEVAGGIGGYNLTVTPILPGYVITPGCIGTFCWLDVVAPVMSRNILFVTATDGSGNTLNTIPVYVAVGHDGVNTIPGSDGPDMLFGLGGWDTLVGHGGNDLLCGGADNDTLKGHDGLDTLSGGAGGNDWCYGGNPNPPNTPPGDVQDGSCETVFGIP